MLTICKVKCLEVIIIICREREQSDFGFKQTNLIGKVERLRDMSEGGLVLKHEVKAALAGMMPGLEASFSERL